MTESSVEKQVREILSDKLGRKISEINADSRLVEDLNLDSFTAIEMAFALEDRFNLKISDAELSGLKTVKDIVVCVDSRVSKTGQA